MTTQYDIIALLDSSGSMASMGKEPIQAINCFMDEQKQANLDGTFSLWTFDTKVNKVIDDESLNDVKHLSEYTPKGMTALHDVIGKAITTKLSKTNKTNVICLIVTDGSENSSVEYTGSRIKEMISEMETKNGWKFIYLGANQDVVVSGGNIGMHRNLCVPFNENMGELIKATRQVSAGVSAYRSGSGQLSISPHRVSSCPAPTLQEPPPLVRQSKVTRGPPPLVRQSCNPLAN